MYSFGYGMYSYCYVCCVLGTVSLCCSMYFDVFLTVHHSIEFSKYQLSAQFF